MTFLQREEEVAEWEEEAASAASDNAGLYQFNMVLKVLRSLETIQK